MDRLSNLPPGVSVLDEHINPPDVIDIEETEVRTWFERDRAYVGLAVKDDQDHIVEWWDEAVAEAIEDGFLDPRDYHGSAYSYAKDMGMLVRD